MTTTIPGATAKNAAAALFAATLVFGLGACGSSEAETVTLKPEPAPALTQVAEPTPHDFSHEPRCHPGRPCR